MQRQLTGYAAIPPLKWAFVFLVALSAGPAIGAEHPPATIALPGLYAPNVDPASRDLFGQQLAATLEGQGFTVLDADALSARDIEVPQEGCFSPLPPLCGAGPGVDQVLLGSVVPSDEAGGYKVEVELVDGRSRRSLWAGQFEAATEGEVSAGLVRIATEHLPTASRRARFVDDRPRFLGMTQHTWGSGMMIGGVLMMAGGGLFAIEADGNRKKLDTFGRSIYEPVPPRDAFRMRDTFHRQVIAASVLGAVGLTTAVTGFFVTLNAPPKSVSVQFVPVGESGTLVISGVFP